MQNDKKKKQYRNICSKNIFWGTIEKQGINWHGWSLFLFPLFKKPACQSSFPEQLGGVWDLSDNRRTFQFSSGIRSFFRLRQK